MDGPPDRWAELHNLADLRVKFIDETGLFCDAKPYLAGAYHDRSPLMHESGARARRVSPEASQFLENAEDHLERGQAMTTAGLNYDAGRLSRCLRRRQALIVERTGGKVVNSDEVVNIEFLRVHQRRFLSRAYDFKAVADYDTGGLPVVTCPAQVRPTAAIRPRYSGQLVNGIHLEL